MDADIQKIAAGEKLPQFDLPVDIIVYDNVHADLLKCYASFPCKIEACIFCYVVSGNVTVTINLWDYEIRAHDFVVIMPGSFLQIKAVSNDLQVAFEGFSSAFLKHMNFWKMLSPIMLQVFQSPVFSLEPELADIFRDIFSVMTRINDYSSAFQAGSIAQNAMALTIDILSNAIKSHRLRGDRRPTTREQEIVAQFLQIAFENYREEHRISFYAQEANLTLSHFCNVISKSIGMTPQEVIMNLIIMDAKTQLKRTSHTAARISASLNFSTPTSFNRYFRKYTGMTPQEYRKS